MDSHSQSQQRPGAPRQGLSFHFEMGVSWTPKNADAPKNHRISFPPKKNREEATTRTHTHLSDQAGDRRYGAATSLPIDGPARSGLHQGRQTRPVRQHQSDVPHVGNTSRRARSSPSPHPYRSAPPQNQAMMQGTEGYGHMVSHGASRRNVPEVWKALPPTPTPSILTVHDIPFMYPSQEVPGTSCSSDAGEEQSLEANITDVARDLAPRPPSERPAGFVKEMESLATAMMTIDNGFEDQWWNQGTRLVNVGGELIPANVRTRTFSPGMDIVHTVSHKHGMRVRTAVDEVSVQSADYNPGEPVSPVSNVSGPVLNYIYF